MDANSWVPLAHEIGIIIAAASGVIAAVSSLRNGRTLNGGHQGPKAAVLREQLRRRKKKTSNGEDPDMGAKKPDWYKPPQL
jgi:hypothetical protein